MASTQDIGRVFAERLREGAGALRDASGAPVTIEVPLTGGDTVELGVNPHHGFFLRLRAGLDRLAEAEREAVMTRLVELTAAARFGSGWIGGCEGGEAATLAVALDPAAEGPAIAALIEKGSAILRPSSSAASGPAGADPLLIGENWLRI